MNPCHLVAGVRPLSLGASFARGLSRTEVPVIGLDGSDTRICLNDALRAVTFDLNPFVYGTSFAQWTSALEDALTASVAPEQATFQTVVLAAGRYHVAPLVQHDITARLELLGVNICGKFELLHTVMRLNESAGLSNASVLNVVDIGSLHALRSSSHRAYYNATKAAGLALCEALHAGAEVRSVIHIAPGPIDTPMLHRNHWVLQGRGDEVFWRTVYQSDVDLYERIFLGCDVGGLQEANELFPGDRSRREVAFHRYCHHRCAQKEAEEGITDPEVLADEIIRLLDTEDTCSGVYTGTSPRGELRLDCVEFDSGPAWRPSSS